MRSISWLAAGLAWVGVAGAAAAVGGTATDQAATLTYPSDHWTERPRASLSGIGKLGQLFHSGWWYRAEGDSREQPLPPPDSERYTNGIIEAVWNNVDGKGFRIVETTWVVDTEGPSGGFLTQMRARNDNASPRPFTFFHYLDVDLGAGSGGDTATLVNGHYLRLADGDGTTAFYKASGSTHHRAAPYPLVRDTLNDAVVTNLDDSGLPFGPGDLTAAYQFGPSPVQPAAEATAWVSLVVNPAGSAGADVASRLPAVGDRVKGDFLGVLPYPALYGQSPDLNSRLSLPMRRTTQLLGFFGPLPPTPAASMVGTDDFDGDDKDEAVFRDTSSGAAYVGRSLISGAPTLPFNWKLSATGDFDHDGKADILWRNTISQKLVVWTMNGAAKTGSLVPNPDQAANANWEVAGAADFNGDGNRDLLWYNQTTGKIVLWYLDRSLVRTTGLFTTPDGVGSNAWRVVAVGDFGRGPGGQYGTQDVVWQNDVSHKLVVWHMDQNATRTSGVFTTPDKVGPGDTVVGPR